MASAQKILPVISSLNPFGFREESQTLPTTYYSEALTR
jgi:hypothetical protein